MHAVFASKRSRSRVRQLVDINFGVTEWFCEPGSGNLQPPDHFGMRAEQLPPRRTCLYAQISSKAFNPFRNLQQACSGFFRLRKTQISDLATNGADSSKASIRRRTTVHGTKNPVRSSRAAPSAILSLGLCATKASISPRHATARSSTSSLPGA